ncbi:DUF4215 domain-containing protein, partial [Patescibacteria group bacterium]|nr:DUF4215 domain-containing protein [Patescibacteria group bacterium]
DIASDADIASDNNNAGVVEAFCGDSVVQPGESCDDGNKIDGDGCDSTCIIEEVSPLKPEIIEPTPAPTPTPAPAPKPTPDKDGSADITPEESIPVIDELLKPVVEQPTIEEPQPIEKPVIEPEQTPQSEAVIK